MKQIALCLVVAAMAAGCASKDPKDTAVTDMSKGGTTGTTASTGQTGQTTGQGTQRPPTGTEDDLRTNPKLAKRSVYFDYDSNAVKDEYRGLVQDHSRYMTTAKKDSRIRIEGNADERGSREYNLALGQRRAEAVKRALILPGARDGQIESVSLGEEKPICNDHAEGCWAKNRRDDMLYNGEY